MRRRSVLSETAELLADLVVNGSRTICFLRSRRGIELIQRFTRHAPRGARRAAASRRESRPTAAATRPSSGARSRRRLAGGELLAVVATDALELGIDIGELDAAICVTFPGTVASLRQMWGRAGRRSDGIAVYVAGEDALDQFFCRHPEEFLDPTGRGGDPRPHQRAHPDRPPLRRRVRGAARGDRTQPGGATTRSSARAGASAPTPWSAPGGCGSAATAAICRGRPGSRPARSRCAPPRWTRSRWSNGHPGS